MIRDLAVEKEWKIRFEEYKQSGLSISAWCSKNGFKSSTFHYWMKRFKAAEPIIPAVKAEFAEIVLESCNANNTIKSKKIHLFFDSFTIDIADGFNSDTLTELLKVLKRL